MVEQMLYKYFCVQQCVGKWPDARNEFHDLHILESLFISILPGVSWLHFLVTNSICTTPFLVIYSLLYSITYSQSFHRTRLRISYPYTSFFYLCTHIIYYSCIYSLQVCSFVIQSFHRTRLRLYLLTIWCDIGESGIFLKRVHVLLVAVAVRSDSSGREIFPPSLPSSRYRFSQSYTSISAPGPFQLTNERKQVSIFLPPPFPFLFLTIIYINYFHFSPQASSPSRDYVYGGPCLPQHRGFPA